VRINQARYDDAPGEVDDLGVMAVNIVVDVGDAVALYEDVDGFCIGPVRGHGDHTCSTQHSAHHRVGFHSWDRCDA
jgi:hypothetical protein